MNVSVVIPTCNDRSTVTQCLRRITAQLTTGDEVIIVDGGSNDGTERVARRFDFTRVMQSPGISTGTARQLGASIASTEIVATTDPDTTPPETWVHHIRSHFESDPDLVLLWGSITDRHGIPIRNLMGKFRTLTGSSSLNIAFSRSAFNRVRAGFPDLNFMSEETFAQRLASAGRTVRDPALDMAMDVDRRRFRTIPIIVGGAASVALGYFLGGNIGAAIGGVGAGIAVSEVTAELFERFTQQAQASRVHPHHDLLGGGLMLLSPAIGGGMGAALAGAGTGLVGHHVTTEGFSFAPSKLANQTNAVCEGEHFRPMSGSDDRGKQVALTVGGVAGSLALIGALGRRR